MKKVKKSSARQFTAQQIRRAIKIRWSNPCLDGLDQAKAALEKKTTWTVSEILAAHRFRKAYRSGLLWALLPKKVRETQVGYCCLCFGCLCSGCRSTFRELHRKAGNL